jgi:hypothetical protein
MSTNWASVDAIKRRFEDLLDTSHVPREKIFEKKQVDRGRHSGPRRGSCSDLGIFKGIPTDRK